VNTLRNLFYWLLLFAFLGECALRYHDTGIAARRPQALMGRSLTYETSLFARHVFPQKAQRIVPSHGDAALSGSVEYQINDKGYRGKDFDIEKKPGVIRIMVYGGSSVFDLDEPEGKDWPHRLEAGLRQDGFSNAEVINAGVPRHTSIDDLGRLMAEGHQFKPDILILYTTWDDIKDFASDAFALRRLKPYRVEGNPFLYYYNSVDQFLGDRLLVYSLLRYHYLYWKYKPGIEAAQKKDGHLDISPRAVAQFKLDVELFVDAARDINAVPVLMTEASLIGQTKNKTRLAHVEEYLPVDFSEAATAKAEDIIRSVAAAKNVSLIDAKAALIEKDKPLFNDHAQLNDSGSQMLADLVKKQLVTWVPCPLNQAPEALRQE